LRRDDRMALHPGSGPVERGKLADAIA
jgi:hypothetical protein